MHISLLGAATSLLCVSASAFTPASTSGTDKLNDHGMTKLKTYLHKNRGQNSCNLDNAVKRQEWSSLSKSNKKKYTDAVLCLQSRPARSGSIAPGAKSRYDDFLATHINQTLTIHGTGNFLSWHRYYVYTFEEALRNECGYKGYIPYANWGKYAEDLLNSPIFDGSDYSISGNGEYRNHTGASIPSVATPFIQLPAGSGGGCVTSGPFKNMTVNLGPLAPVFDDITPNPRPDGLGYNPRCLRRDIGVYAASIASTDANSTDLIRENNYIGDFQTTMQGDFPAGLLGVHTAGHFFAGGDPGADIFSSPGDPWFWLHHAQIDRTWWIWQNQDPASRSSVNGNNSLAGTITLNNSPPSRNTRLDDVIDLGVNAESILIRDALSTTAGPFCYVYV
ncbi:Di-copper centre-containing protein [Aureobasidium pullulans]|uniref:Di-copper centre-containing protein n=1 Tax=Aureobasidium pullulans TaxID=5580 RepID=A0A4S9F7Z6_AURPU|nr:Di-copper centre-containing protein [Aureobasidium pullulans]